MNKTSFNGLIAIVVAGVALSVLAICIAGTIVHGHNKEERRFALGLGYTIVDSTDGSTYFVSPTHTLRVDPE